MKFRVSTRVLLAGCVVVELLAQLFNFNRNSPKGKGFLSNLGDEQQATIVNTKGDEEQGDGTEHPDTNSPRRLLNPFRDIKLSLKKSNNTSDGDEKNNPAGPLYSSHHCVNVRAASASEIDNSIRFLARTCKFTNLYYSPQEKRFHYYPSPFEQGALLRTDEDLQAMMDSMTVSIGQQLKPDESRTDIWRPEVHESKHLPDKYAVISNPSNLAFLLYHPSYSFNFGHMLWDDLLSLFSMLDIFGLTGLSGGMSGDLNIFPIPFYMENTARGDPLYRCDVRRAELEKTDGAFVQRWHQCTKMYRKIFPSFFRYETHKSGDILRSGNWLNGMDSMLGGVRSNATNDLAVQEDDDEKSWNQMIPDTSLVLVPTVLAGSGRHGQMSCRGDCGIHRASQLFSFREFLKKNALHPNYESFNKQKHVPAGYITFSLPAGSSRPQEVSFFKNIIPVAKELYGEDKVRIVDMATLSMQEEILLAMDTAVLFVNHGGGSATSLFLPVDAGVFLYTAGKCISLDHIWCDRGKNHYDSVFYESNSYMRPTWIHPNEREDVMKIKLLLQNEYKKTMDSWTLKGMKVGSQEHHLRG